MKQNGLAKALFFKNFQRSPWNQFKSPSFSGEKKSILFANYLAQKKITYFDYVLTKRMLRNYPEISESAAFFICHLILSAKNGHLCVKIEQNQIFPPVDYLWENDTNLPLSNQEMEELADLIRNGSTLIPSELVSQVDSKKLSERPQTPICQFKHCYYLQRHWVYESIFLDYLNQHLASNPEMQLDLNRVNSEMEEMRKNKEMNNEQCQAILQALTCSFSLITGGPGTGKTYTAGKLIRLFWKNLSPEYKNSCQIALAAPTGKAAANLQRSLSHAVSDLKDFPSLQAKTLHNLLNINQPHKAKRLNADLILIDESSMMDVKIMAHLFKSLKKGSRLILLGDPYQLPSVEAGNVFLDLTQLTLIKPNISSTHLLTCLRTELSSIVDFADLVKNGHAEEALRILSKSLSGVNRLNFSDDPQKAQKELIAYAANFFPSHFNDLQELEFLFQTFNSFRLLSPMRKGLFGVETLNSLIWQFHSQKHFDQGWIAIPILITANDYRQSLFNGETGILIRRLPIKKFHAEDFAIFSSRNQEGSMRKIPSVLLPKFEMAYCLSVHKSQGSEFDRVVLALPEGAETFGRQVFYTAVTRARKQIEIYGSNCTIKKTILQQEIRLSGILERSG